MKRRDESYVIQSAPWHASHALTRQYTMVLHLHMLSSSGPLGPTYVSPGSRGSMVNAARDEAAKADKRKRNTHYPRCMWIVGKRPPYTDFD